MTQPVCSTPVVQHTSFPSHLQFVPGSLCQPCQFDPNKKLASDELDTTEYETGVYCLSHWKTAAGVIAVGRNESAVQLTTPDEFWVAQTVFKRSLMKTVAFPLSVLCFFYGDAASVARADGPWTIATGTRDGDYRELGESVRGKIGQQLRNLAIEGSKDNLDALVAADFSQAELVVASRYSSQFAGSHHGR